MATLELDDAMDPLDGESIESLVGEEMEKFDRESRERSREPTAEPTSRGGTRHTSLSEKIMISRHTQTVAVMQKQSSFKQAASSIMTLNSVNNARTMTRQLRTAQRRGTVRKRSMKKTTLPVLDDEEEIEDDFYQLEAGNSRHDRQPARIPKITVSRTLSDNRASSRGNEKETMGPKLAQSWRFMNKSLSRTFSLSRIGRRKPSHAPMKDRVKRDNKRAQMGFFSLLYHDIKLAIDRQKNERNEFKLFLKTIKSIQGELGSSTATLFIFVRYLLMINILSAVLWVAFVVIPQAISFDYSALSDERFKTLSLFLGDDLVAKSWLFFKGYDETLPSGYKMYVAYLMTHFVSIFAVFVTILFTIGNDITREGTASTTNVRSLAMNLFTCWDHSINSRDAIKKLQKSTYSNFKDLLCELMSAKKERTVSEQRRIYALRALAWIIWAILLAGAITAIVFVVTISNTVGNTEFIYVYGPSIALTAINAAVPFLMQKLPLIESYDIGRSEQYVTIFRVYMMRMVSLCTFIITLVFTNDTDDDDCSPLYWGQEFYKLCIINTISNVGTLLKYPVFLYLLDKRVEVDLPSTLMSLIYFQGCIWFGNLFCPLLSFMACISHLVYFFAASKIVKKCCQPPTKRYNSQNSKFFNSFLALTVVIMMVITVIIIVTVKVSCGPYSANKFELMWDTFTVLKTSFDSEVQSVFDIIFSAAFVVPLLFLLLIIIYFLQIHNAKANIKNDFMANEIEILREEKSKFLKEKKNSHVDPPQIL